MKHLKMYKTHRMSITGVDYIMIYKKPGIRSIAGFLNNNSI